PAADVNDHGEFLLNQFDEGRYYFDLVPMLLQNAYVSAVRLGDSSNPDLSFDVTPATKGPLEIQIKAGAASVRGTVHDEHGSPVSDVTVVLEPDASRRSNPNLFRRADTTPSGQFTIFSISPGDYQAFALKHPDSFAIRSSAFLSQYEHMA